MKRVVVFTGPSLSHEEARNTLPTAEYLPPVRRGDIDRLLADPPAVIGIVDGQFFQSMSISPKEVLRAMRAGVTVLGSSSIGALRAAELYPFGMVGVGEVFRWYKSGRIDADDEVAMVYSPEDLTPLSVPLVNMRYALQVALAGGLINAQEKQQLLRIAKGIYFPQRTYSRLLRLAPPELGRRPDLAEFLEFRAPSLKRLDGLQLLHAIERGVSLAK